MTKETNYIYDLANRLEEFISNNLQIKYKYDINSNVNKKNYFVINETDVKPLYTVNYEYNNLEWEDQLTKFNNESITYDAIGNPLTIGDATLTWKVGRRLTTYTKGDLSVSYEYNVDGIRTSKIVNNQTTNYILEWNNIIIEESPKGMIYYLYDSNELIGLKYSNQTYFYKKNLQGDIIGLYNSNYEQIVTYTYDSWGKVLSVKDSNGNEITDTNHIGLINPFRYRSYYYDEETKLYYLNSRYYNPTWCRFVNVDSYIGTADKIITYNLYVYCENNPIKNIDSSGEFALVIPFIPGIIKGAIEVVVAITAAYLASKVVDSIDVDIDVFKNHVDTNETKIYRFGGTNPCNYVPSKKDVKYNSCLSFSTIPAYNSGETTIEKVNATGVLKAYQDGEYHVSVCPIGETVQEWREQGTNSIWTKTLKSIIVKWDGN